MTERVLHRHLIRTIMSFCRLAERSVDYDTRDDLFDSCMALLDICLTGHPPIRDWCHEASALLDRLDDSHSLLRAQARLLHLRVAVGVPASGVGTVKTKPSVAKAPAAPKSAPMDLGKNQRRIFEWLREHSGARTRELVAQFAAELSDRTVKRSLKELVEAGVIRKVEDGGSVSYEVAGEVGRV